MTAAQRHTKTGYVLGEGVLDDLHSAGNLEHVKRSPLVAIKYFCLNCMGGSLHAWRMADGTLDGPHLPYDEVRGCTTTHCELWPFRNGHNPHTRNRGNSAGLRKYRQSLSATASNAAERVLAAREGTGSPRDTTRPTLRSAQASSAVQTSTGASDNSEPLATAKRPRSSVSSGDPR
jgi:hypothetical protein